ncbi:alpha/beta fold hydrolase [Aphanizomenon flos-aquae NRERC-008]|uniref:Alpha/beta fold hydrolase n=1 Tax=Aphanizomenon flos-aquae FACHB-1249 TaxID=2692889 RepID=A0ABR8IM56_APHFL|nr:MULTISPECIES: alpha/beta fold hydrolase [Aphanizomenon]MBD2389390.1 alpha/beta fold hydrolase [Aphanizomenon flos-aquae FACHB-1171]MBD2558591.1 alpha/beta fold hydrolase [Aphanizomenon flos-aquae FACHB-1290]MBD2633051.1 alpha/beta fold hydrolase [Aphanizomenon sp. FACHB-1399]MBD2656450.1 alpha/beta fold hydrolase [Aphanizomenon flos-aquae FACHB-1265]MBD2672628.1 alpha/beta fold hydrolase [Aphanizomenon flos-aquae FACHB-1416]MBD2684399.1 alpha/beta fold hydrolase [Aphanizomenon flos-aquae F
MSIQEHKITVDSLEWFYREAEPIGRSDLIPVLLLHGIVSQSYSWRNVIPSLAAQGTRAIAPDWIGYGFSGKPEKQDFAYTPDAFITALAGFVEVLELERFSLVVQGFLGSVGLQYALRYPEKIANIAILNTPISTWAKIPWKIKQMGLPLAGDIITQDPLLVDRTLESGSCYRIEDQDLDVYRKPFLKSSAAGRSLLNTIRNLQIETAMIEIENGFKNWQQPILVQWGMIDPWLSINIAETFVQSVANGEIIKLNNVGHYPQEHYHEVILQDLLPFVRRSESN